LERKLLAGDSESQTSHMKQEDPFLESG